METMSAKAHLNHLRMTPRKVGAVLGLIRGKQVDEAKAILRHTPRAASAEIDKLLDSAIANGENNFAMSREDLYITECFANEGPTLKRIRPRAQGRAYRINKRTSHVTIVLKEKE